MTGPDGWKMTHCHCDARAGGTIRCDWAPVGGGEGAFYLTAEFRAVDAPHRIVHVERMFLPDATPDNQDETTFADHDHDPAQRRNPRDDAGPRHGGGDGGQLWQA